MILVAGGTGFVGGAIVRELLARGESVAVLGRDAARTRKLYGDKVEARVANVSDPAQLDRVMQGVDTVINAVQFPNNPIERPSRGFTFEEVDYKGTVNQVNAAKAAAVKRFVYISGVGAAQNAPYHWFRFKWMAEQYLANSGLEWAVLRPTWVFGPGDHALNKLVGFTNFLPFLPMFGDGKQDMQPVFVDDVARAAADLATKPDVTGQVYEIGGPQRMAMNEVLKTALRAKGRKRFILHQPVFVGKLIGSVAQMAPFTPPLTADAVEFILQPAVADMTSLDAKVPTKHTPLAEGLATYMK